MTQPTAVILRTNFTSKRGFLLEFLLFLVPGVLSVGANRKVFSQFSKGRLEIWGLVLQFISNVMI